MYIIDNKNPKIYGLKLNIDNIKIFDKNHNEIDANDVKSLIGTYIKSIIELKSIIISNENIHINIKLHQIKITQPPSKKIILSEYSFNSDSEEDENYYSDYSENYDNLKDISNTGIDIIDENIIISEKNNIIKKVDPENIDLCDYLA